MVSDVSEPLSPAPLRRLGPFLPSAPSWRGRASVGLPLTTGIGSLTRGPPQSLVRVGLAAVEPLFCFYPPPLLLLSAGWVFLFPLALPLARTQSPIRPLGRLPIPVGFFK